MIYRNLWKPGLDFAKSKVSDWSVSRGASVWFQGRDLILDRGIFYLLSCLRAFCSQYFIGLSHVISGGSWQISRQLLRWWLRYHMMWYQTSFTGSHVSLPLGQTWGVSLDSLLLFLFENQTCLNRCPNLTSQDWILYLRDNLCGCVPVWALRVCKSSKFFHKSYCLGPKIDVMVWKCMVVHPVVFIKKQCLHWYRFCQHPTYTECTHASI